MNKNHTCKILAIGIIVLFIGVGIHPAFAVEDKSSNSENKNQITKSGDIYQNTNCFIIGKTSEITKLGPSFLVFFKGDIGFGGYVEYGTEFISGGWIYTNGESGKWRYEGQFIGENGRIDIRFYTSMDVFTVYIGVNGFRGLLFGGFLGILPGQLISGSFIGNADSIVISSI